MAHGICPWWLGCFLVNPLRRLWHKPEIILKPFVTQGMLVIEPGCGMGYFTIEMARLVGPSGKVVAIDVQPKMLAGLQRRARKAAVLDRIDSRLSTSAGLNLDDLAGRGDFALAFAVVHELADESHFFTEMHRTLRSGGKLLIAEPRGHVTDSKFHASLQEATGRGFRLMGGPAISGSRTAVLERL